MFRILRIAAGAFSLAILLGKGLHLAFGPVLVVVLGLYEAAMRLTFSFVDPPIVEALAWLRGEFGWHLILYAHWKHVLVLLWLFFGWITKKPLAERREFVSTRFPRRAVQGHWAAGSQIELTLVRKSWGLFTAFLAAVAAGTASLDGANAIWMIPLCGVAGYALLSAGIDAYLATREAPLVGASWPSQFWGLFKDIPPQILVGAIVIGVCTQASRQMLLPRLANAGPMVLLALALLLVLWNLSRGIRGTDGLWGLAKRSLGHSPQGPGIAVTLADNPGRAIETAYFDRRADREINPPAPITALTKLPTLKNVQMAALLPEALLVLGTLVLFALSFW